MDICILDDDRRSFSTYAAAVKSCFEEFGVTANVDVYDNAESLRKRLSTVRYDVMFLDIDMPKEDGIEFARSLRKKNDAVPIIFVTAREERMFEVFAVQPFGFVRKGRFLGYPCIVFNTKIVWLHHLTSLSDTIPLLLWIFVSRLEFLLR